MSWNGKKCNRKSPNLLPFTNKSSISWNGKNVITNKKKHETSHIIKWQKSEYKHLKFSRSKSSRVTHIINIDEDSENSEIDENSVDTNVVN